MKQIMSLPNVTHSKKFLLIKLSCLLGELCCYQTWFRASKNGSSTKTSLIHINFEPYQLGNPKYHLCHLMCTYDKFEFPYL
ncbi:hypothetical protein BpHYR1_001509 [Brachionus plicatilis]|uniref:Uncharacterized protein n=1 Tax=Brachionus plicatilis TaxID=10195 RepID=A0A3M7PCF2_BRAPC|nr:hypothetical protein BpHYR1_001509 [Brachionus plicatilis]